MSEEGDEPPFPPLAPEGVEGLSDEALETQVSLKQQAEEALEDGDQEMALKQLTAAVGLGCATALLYCKRATVLLELGRPRAAARDCTAALAVNADSGKAYRIRARARLAASLFSPRELEMLLEAQGDYRKSLAIDDDEATAAEAQEVDARMRELQATEVAERSAAALAARQIWEIVGGADRGGVVVRAGAGLASPQVPARLTTGAMVREVALDGERLQFEKVSGVGPDEGWISITLKDKVLACRVTAGGRAAEGAAEDAEEEEPVFPAMAPRGVYELTDDELDRQAALKGQAAEALEDGNHELALERLTEAIGLGCPSALMYGRRAEVLLKLGRPRAAINDCDAALDINPDNAKAYKIRARAQRKLKRWAEAHADFTTGLKLDYDEGTYEESLAVAGRMRDIRATATERRVKVETAAEERRLREAGAAREAEARARAAEQERATEASAKKAKDEAYKRKVQARLAADADLGPIFQVAKRNNFMTDFMGMKRGGCKCNRCDVYVWRPVRLSSCASRNAQVNCLICGCEPNKHKECGHATQEDCL